MFCKSGTRFTALNECNWLYASQLMPGSGGIQADGSVDHMSKMSSGADVFSPVIKKSPLTINKKIYEFYTAPITKFWMHTVCVALFPSNIFRLKCFLLLFVSTRTARSYQKWLTLRSGCTKLS